MARRFSFGFLAFVLALASGCDNHPTYPKAHVTEALQGALQEEQLNASVQFVDHTVGVSLIFPGALSKTDTQIELGPAFDEATRKALTAIHRVLLSTDAEVNFYVLLLSDPNAPGAYLTLVRYMDDIKRANANMLDTPEMFARTVFELNFVGPTNPVTIQEYVPRDIRLEEFLSWQLARRIQTALTERLRSSGTVNVGHCAGRFHDGEFVFTLDVTSADGPMDEDTVQEMFAESTNVVAKVLSSYHFDSFNAIRLVHPLTGKNLVLPKTRLELFR